VKTLSPQERKELAKMLIDMMDAPQQVEAADRKNTGKSSQLLDEVGYDSDLSRN
jgi:hypothetical protein